MQIRKQTDQHRRIYVNADSATMHQLDHCAALEVEAYFKENASRHRVLPTLSDQPAKYQTRQIFMRCQLWEPRRPGRRQNPGPERKTTKRRGHSQRARKRRETLNDNNTPGPPARRTTPRRTHGAGTEQRSRRTSQSHPERSRR